MLFAHARNSGHMVLNRVACEGDISFFTSVLVPAAVSLQRTVVGYNAATVCPCRASSRVSTEDCGRL